MLSLLLVSVLHRWSSGRVAKQRVLTSLASELPSVLYRCNDFQMSAPNFFFIGPMQLNGTHISVLGSVVCEDGNGEAPEEHSSRFGRCEAEALVHCRVHVLPSVKSRVGLVWVVASAAILKCSDCCRVLGSLLRLNVVVCGCVGQDEREDGDGVEMVLRCWKP